MLSVAQTFLLALSSAGALGDRHTPKIRDADKVIQSIGSLLQRDDKPSVQAISDIQTLASQLITPGVSGSLDSALTTVISEIEQNVESKLFAAFASMQNAVDTSIARLDWSTALAVQRKTNADDADNSWFNCVRSEKAKLEEVEQADRDLQSARNSVTEPCQLEQDRTVFEKTELDLPTFTCDHSESGNCDAQLENFKIQAGSMVDGLTNDVSAQKELYNEAKTACAAAHADVVAKQSVHESAVGEFNAKKIECAGYHESRQLAFCLFGTNLQDKCHESSMYLYTMTKIDGSANYLSLPDLRAEWDATYVVKCVLSKVMTGGSVDDGAVSECERTVNFEEQVGQLDRKQDAYNGLTTADKFTCSEETITFLGETWEVGPASSDYVVKDYSPAVTFNSFSPPFTFCPE